MRLPFRMAADPTQPDRTQEFMELLTQHDRALGQNHVAVVHTEFPDVVERDGVRFEVDRLVAVGLLGLGAGCNAAQTQGGKQAGGRRQHGVHWAFVR